jgi:PAS domain S-box-containing protein
MSGKIGSSEASSKPLIPARALQKNTGKASNTNTDEHSIKNKRSAQTHDNEMLSENPNDAIRIINKDYSVRRINNAFAEMTGVNQNDVVGKKCWEVFPSHACHTAQCRLSRILHGEDIIQEEIERIKPNGQVIPCRVNAIPLCNDHGKPTGIIETFVDITEKKRLLTHVKETEDRYRTLIELGNNIGEAIVMLQNVDDIEAKHTFVSDQWANTTGYTKEELLGMSIFDVISPAGKKAFITRFRRRIAGKLANGLFETTIVRKDGKELSIESTAALTTYQGKPANVLYLRDITDRKKMEKELSEHKNHLTRLVKERTSQLQKANDRLTDEINKRKKAEEEIAKQKETLQSLFDAIPAGIYLLDHEARITYINKYGIKSIATSLEYSIGKTVYEAQPERSSSLAAYMRDLEVIQTGEPKRVIFTNYEPPGARWFQLDRYPYRDAAGNVVGEICMEVEITDRIDIENKLKQALGQERVLRDQLEIQIQQRIEFTRALVHELKTPLTPLLMASEILSKASIREEAHNTAKIIYNGAIALNNRIDELLDLAKGEIGLLKLDTKPQNMVYIISEVCDYMSYAIKSKNQEFTCAIPDTMPIINVDKQRIRQILINLLDNANKYTPRKGRINLCASYTDDHIIVEVSDTGLGIATEDQVGIFEPYYALKKDAHVHRGMGIGLSLTKMLVSLHGGKIELESKKGKGSLFKLYLPFKRDAT